MVPPNDAFSTLTKNSRLIEEENFKTNLQQRSRPTRSKAPLQPESCCIGCKRLARPQQLAAPTCQYLAVALH